MTSSQSPREEGATIDFDVIIGGHAEAEDDEGRPSSLIMDENKIRTYMRRLRLDLTPDAPHGHAFVNGKYFIMDDVRLFSLFVFSDYVVI